MNNNSHFKRGSGVYQCHDCKKMTRDTGECESGLDLCLLCYTKGGNGNQLSDDGFKTINGLDPWEYMDQASTVAEASELLAKAYKQGPAISYDGECLDVGDIIKSLETGWIGKVMEIYNLPYIVSDGDKPTDSWMVRCFCIATGDLELDDEQHFGAADVLLKSARKGE